MRTLEIQAEYAAVAAHRLLGVLSLVAGMAELLRYHGDGFDAELCAHRLAEVEATARDLAGQLELVARGLPAALV
jgi:hypothetical protein